VKGESWKAVNGEGRKEERYAHNNKPDEEDADVQRPWMKRVELPTFEGRDPLGWISRAEKFFEVQ